MPASWPPLTDGSGKRRAQRWLSATPATSGRMSQETSIDLDRLQPARVVRSEAHALLSLDCPALSCEVTPIPYGGGDPRHRNSQPRPAGGGDLAGRSLRYPALTLMVDPRNGQGSPPGRLDRPAGCPIGRRGHRTPAGQRRHRLGHLPFRNCQLLHGGTQTNGPIRGPPLLPTRRLGRYRSRRSARRQGSWYPGQKRPPQPVSIATSSSCVRSARTPAQVRGALQHEKRRHVYRS